MRAKDLFGREKGEVGEMLVINRIELIFLHQPLKMGELHSDHTIGFQQDFHSRDKIIQFGYLGKNVVAQEQISLLTARRKLACRLSAEEFHESGDAFLSSNSGNIRRRLNTQHWDPLFDKILQQIAIVARELYCKTVCVDPEACNHLIGIASGMRQPGV